MVTHSPVGALPLGVIITSDETTSTLIQAFDLFKLCLPDNSFYGKGINGPTVFMTDNCSELREALSKSWPNAKLLLCVFHLMQQVWRWLFERKHNIASHDRTVILLLFKKVVYAESYTEMEETYDELVMSAVVNKYPRLVTYFDTLFDIREDWTLSCRTNLPIRGNNTNNLVEAQFLVLKDEVLNRTKEININGLLDKLTHEFTDHYKVKLLSVSSGKFDGCYSRRFKGLGKVKGDGIGFRLPSQKEKEQIVKNVVSIGEKLYTVPSFSNSEQTYAVDMNVGICECHEGQNGSVCKHQYLLWVSNIETTTNFLPFLDAQERKKYAEIAIGSSMPSIFYEGIHDRIREPSQVKAFQDEGNNVDFTPITSPSPCSSPMEIPNMRRDIEVITAQEVKEDLQKTLSLLENKIETNSNDSNFLWGIAKFCERVEKFPLSKLSSSFHSFGVQSSTSLKVTATSTLNKARKGKIYVQPEAVKRRKFKNGTKNSIVKGMKVKSNPFDKEVSKKRLHKFSSNVVSNEAVSKKAGRSMASKTKHIGKSSPLKKQKVEHK